MKHFFIIQMIVFPSIANVCLVNERVLPETRQVFPREVAWENGSNPLFCTRGMEPVG